MGGEMIRLKEGVKLHGLTPQALFGMMVVDQVFRDHNLQQALWITSVAEGRHSSKSLHYHGRAFDVRLPTIEPFERAEAMLADCCQYLGPDFDVVAESNHWHIEWDPKGPPR